MGVNVTNVKTIAFATSAALAGIAGALFSALLGFVAPESFNLDQMVLMQIMVVVGGLGSLLGPLIGPIVAALMIELLRDTRGLLEIIFGTILIGFVLFQPNGLAALVNRALRLRESFVPRSRAGACATAVEAMAILELEGIGLKFGGVSVLEDVGFCVDPGEVVGLIGPNGAGKTSAMNVITGVHRPLTGSIFLDQNASTGCRRTASPRSGCAGHSRYPCFVRGSTVLENEMLGVEPAVGYGLGGAIGATRTMRRSRGRDLRPRHADARLDGHGGFCRAGGPGPLLLGQQRLVELARALVSRPRVLLLDEPAVGLAPPRVSELAQNIRKIAKTF